MHFLENIRLALSSVRSNILRAVLTLLIIAFGIMSLVGILTAIDSAIYSLNENFSSVGANTLTIKPTGEGVRRRRGGNVQKIGEPISYRQAIEFKERFNFPGVVSISMNCTGSATVKYENEETNPNVIIVAADENFLQAKAFGLELGRNFTASEARQGNNVAIIGWDIVKLLFNGQPERALGRQILAGKLRLTVIGILETKGSSMSQSEDRRVLLPLLTGKRFYGSQRTNYELLIDVRDPSRIDDAISEATGLMRVIRKRKASEDNDFEIATSEGLINIIKDNTVTLRLSAVLIGLITLVGAAIGLMNIMLVSVTERTKEIGIRKAVGAKKSTILTQFLTEAVVICLLGGLLGIFLGVLIGNLVTYFLGGSFLVPVNWIGLSILFCTLVGLISGIYPALKASQLDPIESLRYE